MTEIHAFSTSFLSFEPTSFYLVGVLPSEKSVKRGHILVVFYLFYGKCGTILWRGHFSSESQKTIEINDFSVISGIFRPVLILFKVHFELGPRIQDPPGSHPARFHSIFRGVQDSLDRPLFGHFLDFLTFLRKVKSGQNRAKVIEKILEKLM